MKRKNGYRNVAVVLMVVLLMLCGCKGEAKKEPTQTPVVSTAPEPESTKAPVAEDETDGPYYDTKYPVLKWAMVDTNVEIRDDIARAFNKALLEEGYEFQVEFVMCPVEEGANTYDTFINQTEGKVDLLTIRNLSKPGDGISYPVEDVAYELPIVEFVEHKMLLPLDEYMNKELKGLIKNDKDLIRCTYNGTVYTFPVAKYAVQGRGYQIEKEIFDKSGLTFKEVAKEWWELEEAFKKLYEANDCKPILYYESGMPIPMDYLKEYDMISTTIGIVDGKAVNVFEQKDIKKMLEAWQRYVNLGYTTDSSDEGCLVYQLTDSNGRVIKGQFLDNEMSSEYYCIPYGTIIPNRYSDRFSGGIAICAKSEQVETSLEFINAIEKNKKLRRILNYGLEGKDYKEIDGVIYKINESEFYRSLPMYGESVSKQKASVGSMFNILNTELVGEGYTEKEVTTASVEEESSPYKDFTMDLSKYREELSTMEDLAQMFDQTFSLEGDIDKQLDKFNNDLKKAGIDKVLSYINQCLEDKNAN